MNEKFYLYIIDIYEKKLKELMGEDEYHKFIIAVSKDGFREEIEGMADSEFKDFCLKNFDMITGGKDE